MKIYKIKRFSYADVIPEGIGYVGKATDEYLLNPIESAVGYIDSSRIGKVESVKKKTRIVRGVTGPLKRLISRRKPKKDKRFSVSPRKVISQLASEAGTLLKSGKGPATTEGKKFLQRAGHLSNSYGKISQKGSILNPKSWGVTGQAEKAQKDLGKVISGFYKGKP